MSRNKKEILDTAKGWLSQKVNLSDIGPFNITVEKGEVKFWRVQEFLTKDEIFKVTNFSPEVKVAWYGPGELSDHISIRYNNEDFERIHRDDVLRRKWFKDSLEEAKCKLIVDPRVVEYVFAKYVIVFPYHSRLDWDKLEKCTGKNFEFERVFKKPRKNRVYATVTI